MDFLVSGLLKKLKCHLKKTEHLTAEDAISHNWNGQLSIFTAVTSIYLKIGTRLFAPDFQDALPYYDI